MREVLVEGHSRRGRPHAGWRDRVKEYMCERGAIRGRGLDQAKTEGMDRERWRLFYHGHPLLGHFQRERGIRAIDRIDRYINRTSDTHG